MDGRLLALMSALCFGINPIVLKRGLRGANSDVAVFVGLITGLPLLLLVSPALGGFTLSELAPSAVVYFALGGVLGVFLGRTFLYLSIDRLGSSRASTFKNGAPLVTAVVAFVILRELVDTQRWMGIGLVTVGLMMVGQMARRRVRAMTAGGLAVASLTAVFYGIRPVISKLGLDISPLPLAATLISYVAAVALYVVYFAVTGRLKNMKSERQSLLYFVGGGVLQVTGLSLLNFALELDDVTVIYPISASAPLVTFILSYVVLKNRERLTLWDLFGTTMVVVGVILLLI